MPANSIESDAAPGGIRYRDMAQNLPMIDNAADNQAHVVETIIRPEGGSTISFSTPCGEMVREGHDGKDICNG